MTLFKYRDVGLWGNIKYGFLDKFTIILVHCEAGYELHDEHDGDVLRTCQPPSVSPWIKDEM